MSKKIYKAKSKYELYVMDCKKNFPGQPYMNEQQYNGLEPLSVIKL